MKLVTSLDHPLEVDSSHISRLACACPSATAPGPPQCATLSERSVYLSFKPFFNVAQHWLLLMILNKVHLAVHFCHKAVVLNAALLHLVQLLLEDHMQARVLPAYSSSQSTAALPVMGPNPTILHNQASNETSAAWSDHVSASSWAPTVGAPSGPTR